MTNRFFAFLLCFAAVVTAQVDLARKEAVQQKGVAYLLSVQESGGAWMGMFGHPALTALATLGIYDTPAYKNDAAVREKMNKALDAIVSHAQEDGSIFSGRKGGPGGRGMLGGLLGKKKQAGGAEGGRRGGPGGMGGSGYAVYNTSICLLALATYNRPQDLDVIRKARAYLMGSDAIPKASDGTAAGGFGYGGQTRSDLNNTAWALEALHATDYLDREPFSKNPEDAKKSGLAWDNALKFLTICQNLQATNQSAWVTSAPKEDEGGFIYCPQDAMKDGARAETLRSYGTMTYSGLKSLIYAKVKPDDVRIKSALDWISKYYTLDENPGIGQAGLYYYFHTFSKTLALLNQTELTDAKGQKHLWKAELLEHLVATQRPDGSWCNEKSGRWMESIPQLSTAYCLMALRYIQ